MSKQKKQVKDEVVEEVKEEVVAEENNAIKDETSKKEQKQKEKEELKEAKRKLKEEKKKLKVKQKEISKASKRSDSKIIAIIIIVVMLVAGGIFGLYYYKSAYEVIATFNGGKVTKGDYDVYYKTFANILKQYYGYSESKIPSEIAKKAAIDKIIVKLANEAGTTITEENQKSIDEIFNNNDYVQNFISQGMDLDKTKKLYYNDYLITQYIKDLKEKASDDDIIKYIKETDGDDANLNEYNTSHILFKTTNDDGDKLSDEEKQAVKAKAEEILAKALAGEDFATLAKDNSQDTGTASDGGKYVCYDDGSTVSEYIEAVKGLKNGEICKSLVETTYGYHIIKLNEVVENGRAHSDSERESYSNKFTDGLDKEYNVTVNDKVLNEYIKSVTGSDIPTEDEENKDDETTTSTEDSSEETTETDEETKAEENAE